MTSLRRGDENLHDEHGNHIDPGSDKALQRRVNRHLEAHRRAAIPEEVLRAARELKSAQESRAQAEALEREMREHAIKVARAYIGLGAVKQYEVAKEYGIDARTLRDWLELGAVRRRR